MARPCDFLYPDLSYQDSRGDAHEDRPERADTPVGLYPDLWHYSHVGL